MKELYSKFEVHNLFFVASVVSCIRIGLTFIEPVLNCAETVEHSFFSVVNSFDREALKTALRRRASFKKRCQGGKVQVKKFMGGRIVVPYHPITVKPPNKGHFGIWASVLYSEVVLWWEVQHILLFITIYIKH